MAEYQHLTSDELLHLAEERQLLTDEARLALEGELSRRRIFPTDIDAYRLQREAADEADKLKRAARNFIPHAGFGKKFMGRSSRRRDPGGLFEEYETTMWFVVLWFPIFPIATYTIRRDLERWLGLTMASSEVAIERHPRNWEQILLTWVKAALVVLALRFTFLLLIHHPEWIKRIF